MLGRRSVVQMHRDGAFSRETVSADVVLLQVPHGGSSGGAGGADSCDNMRVVVEDHSAVRRTVSGKWKTSHAFAGSSFIKPEHIRFDHHANQSNVTLDSEDKYWRETLEKLLDSLTVNIFVMILVFVDVVNVLVAVLNDSENDAQVIITFVVLGLFLVELTLRQVAQMMRFWFSAWNIFDVIVIYASIAMAVTQYAMTRLAAEESSSLSGEISAAQSSTTPMRILGRIAMGMRVLRVLVNMRKVNELKGTVATKLRTAVSQNKRRYQARCMECILYCNIFIFLSVQVS